MSKIEIQEKDGMIYSYVRKKWLVNTPEEMVRQKFICDLVNDFGYPIEQISEEYQNDFKARGVRSTRSDIVIYKTIEDKLNNNNAFIVVECKAETIGIHLEEFYQGTEYAAKLRARFLVLHNSKETHYYNVYLDKIPNKEDGFKRITAIPKFDEINDEKRLKEIEVSTIAFDKKSFTDLLFACHNIIRNNDKLSPEAAFDEISKILFIKINYERYEKGKTIFTLKQYQHNKKITEESNRLNQIKDAPIYMQSLFERTKEKFENEHLFEKNEKINIREVSFEQILKKLEIYNLSTTSDDIKGIAFEQFLGRTFRGELGQFFTPRTIVDFMTEILDPQEGEKVCDPTCGSGGFLIKAFEYIRRKIENDVSHQFENIRKELETSNFNSLSEKEQIEIHKKVIELNKKFEGELLTLNIGSRVHYLANNCIYGIDANPRMARVSKMNMIMHGDGHCGVHHHDGLLNINGISDEQFDVILTNPPFGARIDKYLKVTDQDIIDAKEYGKKNYRIEKNGVYINKSIIDLFDVGEMSGLTEVLFMERCLRLLKKGGRMGMVLPEGVLNTSNLQKVREYFEGKAKLIFICSIPQDVFIKAGATVKPSLVFMKRFTEEEEIKYTEVTKKAQEEIRAIYNDEIISLNGELTLLNDKSTNLFETKAERLLKIREIKKRLSQIETAILEEAKPLIKEYFDYEIPIAMVEDAGITTTGGVSENNQLPALQEEYKTYRMNNQLWQENHSSICYTLKPDGKIYRVKDDEEVELAW